MCLVKVSAAHSMEASEWKLQKQMCWGTGEKERCGGLEKLWECSELWSFANEKPNYPHKREKKYERKEIA